MATNNKINGVPAPLDTDVMDSADIRGIAQAVADNKTNISLRVTKVYDSTHVELTGRSFRIPTVRNGMYMVFLSTGPNGGVVYANNVTNTLYINGSPPAGWTVAVGENAEIAVSASGWGRIIALQLT